MAGIHKKTGEGVPQVVDAYIGKPQFAPERIPKQLKVGKGLSRSMAGKQPGIAGSAGYSTKNSQRGIRQKDMARLAGLGQRHDELPQIQTDIFR